jgi:hypothetical protein
MHTSYAPQKVSGVVFPAKEGPSFHRSQATKPATRAEQITEDL